MRRLLAVIGSSATVLASLAAAAPAGAEVRAAGAGTASDRCAAGLAHDSHAQAHLRRARAHRLRAHWHGRMARTNRWVARRTDAGARRFHLHWALRRFRRAALHWRWALWHARRVRWQVHLARYRCADQWYSFVDGRIALNRSGFARPTYLTPPLTEDAEPDGRDYKPVPSPDGSQVAFFRLVEQRPWAFTWKTQIWVMNADGSNPRQLTSGEHTDVNLQWTRDGSNKIFWNRIEPGRGETEPLIGFPFPEGMNVWWTDPDASPGDEVQISQRGVEPLTPYDFAYSGLRDGRIFVRSEGFNEYFLMTPAPYLAGGVSLYEPISYPEPNTLLHKASISPSERRIAYMKVSDAGPIGIATGPDPKSVIAYADFDAEALTISNEVEITVRNLENRTWYPSWSVDEMKIRYACAGECPDPDGPGNGQIYEYDLRTGETTRVSGNDALEYRYPATKGIVK